MIAFQMEHTGIAANDPVALADWYRQHLGFRLLFASNETTLFLTCPGGMIEIYQAQTRLHTKSENYTTGMRHLALLVTDFEAAYNGLLEIGVEAALPPTINERVKLGFFYDGEGNLFHIIQRIIPLPQENG